MDKLASGFHASSPFIDLFTPWPLVAACPYSPLLPWSTGVRWGVVGPVLAVRKSSSFLQVAVVDVRLELRMSRIARARLIRGLAVFLSSLFCFSSGGSFVVSPNRILSMHVGRGFFVAGPIC